MGVGVGVGVGVVLVDVVGVGYYSYSYSHSYSYSNSHAYSHAYAYSYYLRSRFVTLLPEDVNSFRCVGPLGICVGIFCRRQGRLPKVGGRGLPMQT